MLAGGAIAEVPKFPSPLPGSTGTRSPAHRCPHTKASSGACHRAAGLRLRDGVAAARRVRTALRVRGEDTLSTVSALLGTLLVCRSAVRTGAGGEPTLGAGVFPPPEDSSVPARDALLRHFFRPCLVCCCRIHGALTRDGVGSCLPVTPVMSPSNPRRLARKQEGSVRGRDIHGALTLGGAGGGHSRMSGGVVADGAPFYCCGGKRAVQCVRALRFYERGGESRSGAAW